MASPMIKLSDINSQDGWRPQTTSLINGFTQFVADSVDHNTDAENIPEKMLSEYQKFSTEKQSRENIQ